MSEPKTPEEWAQEMVARMNADPLLIRPRRLPDGFVDLPISGHAAEIVRAAVEAERREWMALIEKHHPMLRGGGEQHGSNCALVEWNATHDSLGDRRDWEGLERHESAPAECNCAPLRKKMGAE